MHIEKFESSISVAIFHRIMRLIFWASLIWALNEFIITVDWKYVYYFLAIYFISFIPILIFTNNNLIITEKEISVESSLFKIKRRKFKKSDIKEIIFKDEWKETLKSSIPQSLSLSIVGFIIFEVSLTMFAPDEYKWIQIIDKNNKKFTYYFFGMEYDYYDNSDEILFEDMSIELAKRNIPIRWKSTKDIYFEGLQETADNIHSELNQK